jgi:hypothetical protein
VAENIALALFAAMTGLSLALVVSFAKSKRKHNDKASTARLVRLLAGNSAVLFLLASFGLVGGEIYYRFFYDQTDALDSTKVSVRWFERHYAANNFQCRDDINYTTAITPGKRRISFLGDSFTAGHGIKEVRDRFPNLLRAGHPEWEIHVIARPGFDTGNELKSIEALTEGGYQLGDVVLVYCLNDIQDILPDCLAAVNRVYAGIDGSGWWRRNSYFVNTIAHRLDLATNKDLKSYWQLLRRGYDGPVWEEQRKRLIELRDLVKAKGGRLLVVTFPFLQALGTNYEYQPVHDRLDRFWMEQGVPHLDLLSVYKSLPPKKLTVNDFDSHPNEFANRLAAMAIDKFLKEKLEAAKPSAGNSANQ